MAVAVRVTVNGFEKVDRLLKQLKPPASHQAVKRALMRSAIAVKADATLHQIIRGGKGKVDPKRLTSRSGDLRRSINVETRKLPRAIQVGTWLDYGRAHELGFRGTVSVGAHEVKEHQRSQAFGRKVKKFTVPKHTRKAHSVKMRIKPRPFLQPALDKVSPTFPTIFVEEILKRLPR